MQHPGEKKELCGGRGGDRPAEAVNASCTRRRVANHPLGILFRGGSEAGRRYTTRIGAGKKEAPPNSRTASIYVRTKGE